MGTSVKLCARKHSPGCGVDTGMSAGHPGLPSTRLSARCADEQGKRTLVRAQAYLDLPALGRFQLGLMGHGLSLCLQLFLDDSKMKNFITCFKGTIAPSPHLLYPFREGPGGLRSPTPPAAGEWVS